MIGVLVLQDLKRHFEQFDKRLASSIGLFCADQRVALNLAIFVTPEGFGPSISTLKGWRPRPLDDGAGQAHIVA